MEQKDFIYPEQAMIDEHYYASFDAPVFIGEGMYGRVYSTTFSRKEKTSLVKKGERIALKVLKRDKIAEQAEKFKKEADYTLYSSRRPWTADQPEDKKYETKEDLCPYVVNLYELYKDGHFFSIEICDAGSLSDLLNEKLANQGGFSWAEFRPIFAQIAQGLSAMHGDYLPLDKRAIVHFDLKPDNIMFKKVKGKLVPKIVDFGFARDVSREKKQEGSDASKTYTQPTGLNGTPLTASPEQCRQFQQRLGEGEELDWRSDLFSIGVTAWMVLKGGNPFDPKLGALQLMLDRTKRDSYNDELITSLGLDLNNPEDHHCFQVLAGLLAIQPDERIQSAKELHAALANPDYVYVENTSELTTEQEDSVSDPEPHVEEQEVPVLDEVQTEQESFEKYYNLSGDKMSLLSGGYLECFEKKNDHAKAFAVYVPNLEEKEKRRNHIVASCEAFQQLDSSLLPVHHASFADGHVLSNIFGITLSDLLIDTRFDFKAFLPQLQEMARVADALPTYARDAISFSAGLLKVEFTDSDYDEVFYEQADLPKSFAEFPQHHLCCIPLFGVLPTDMEASMSQSGLDANWLTEYSLIKQFAALIYQLFSGKTLVPQSFGDKVSYVTSGAFSEDGNTLLSETISRSNRAESEQPVTLTAFLGKFCRLEGVDLATLSTNRSFAALDREFSLPELQQEQSASDNSAPENDIPDEPTTYQEKPVWKASEAYAGNEVAVLTNASSTMAKSRDYGFAQLYHISGRSPDLTYNLFVLESGAEAPAKEALAIQQMEELAALDSPFIPHLYARVEGGDAPSQFVFEPYTTPDGGTLAEYLSEQEVALETALPWLYEYARIADKARLQGNNQQEGNDLLAALGCDLRQINLVSCHDGSDRWVLSPNWGSDSSGVKVDSSMSLDQGIIGQEYPFSAQFAGLIYNLCSGQSLNQFAYEDPSFYTVSGNFSEVGNRLLSDVITSQQEVVSYTDFVENLAQLEGLTLDSTQSAAYKLVDSSLPSPEAYLPKPDFATQLALFSRPRTEKAEKTQNAEPTQAVEESSPSPSPAPKPQKVRPKKPTPQPDPISSSTSSDQSDDTISGLGGGTVNKPELPQGRVVLEALKKNMKRIIAVAAVLVVSALGLYLWTLLTEDKRNATDKYHALLQEGATLCSQLFLYVDNEQDVEVSDTQMVQLVRNKSQLDILDHIDNRIDAYVQALSGFHENIKYFGLNVNPQGELTLRNDDDTSFAKMGGGTEELQKLQDIYRESKKKLVCYQAAATEAERILNRPKLKVRHLEQSLNFTFAVNVGEGKQDQWVELTALDQNQFVRVSPEINEFKLTFHNGPFKGFSGVCEVKMPDDNRSEFTIDFANPSGEIVFNQFVPYEDINKGTMIVQSAGLYFWEGRLMFVSSFFGDATAACHKYEKGKRLFSAFPYDKSYVETYNKTTINSHTDLPVEEVACRIKESKAQEYFDFKEKSLRSAQMSWRDLLVIPHDSESRLTYKYGNFVAWKEVEINNVNRRELDFSKENLAWFNGSGGRLMFAESILDWIEISLNYGGLRFDDYRRVDVREGFVMGFDVYTRHHFDFLDDWGRVELYNERFNPLLNNSFSDSLFKGVGKNQPFVIEDENMKGSIKDWQTAATYFDLMSAFVDQDFSNYPFRGKLKTFTN